jgi:hypothetical protein
LQDGPSILKTPDWAAKYAPSRFAGIFNNQPNPNLPEQINIAATKHLGWIYFTDRPTLLLSRYWANQVAAISAFNRSLPPLPAGAQPAQPKTRARKKQ